MTLFFSCKKIMEEKKGGDSDMSGGGVVNWGGKAASVARPLFVLCTLHLALIFLCVCVTNSVAHKHSWH